MDTAIHKGKPFWSGVFDANDGFIREVHPYKRAKAADFHHSYYVSSQSQDAMKQGDAGFFWVDPDGSVNTDWREGSAPKHIVDAIQDQIEPIPHKDNGGGITAYQGGPHSVGEEGFLDEKIGTGEGFQSYGHGHYFAEHEPVAQGYKNALSSSKIFVNNNPHDFSSSAADEIVGKIENGAKPQVRYPVEYVIGDMTRNENLSLDDAIKKMREDYSHFEPQNLDEAEELLKKSNLIIKSKGHMHEVSINAHPDHFLDWDKPLSEQSDHVKGAISNLFGKISKNPIGREIHEKAKMFVRNNFLPPEYTGDISERASKLLKNSGIHGIRYLDAGSRDTGIGTRNYVVFDPKRVDIKRRYKDGGEVDDDGITAYHGSPHDFDQFDMAKIGKGVGEQAYGHGLYFTGHEPTAIDFRDRATASKNINDFNLYRISGSNEEFEPQKQGHMYEVNISAHPDHMLDWNKPLSEQSPYIVKSIFDARKDNPTLFNVFKSHFEKDSTGMDFYQALATQHPNGYQGASEFLQRSGVHGVKYRDENSRDKGKGTTNYVVFDPKNVDVKRKYEQGGEVDDEGGDVRTGDNSEEMTSDTHSIIDGLNRSKNAIMNGHDLIPAKIINMDEINHLQLSPERTDQLDAKAKIARQNGDYFTYSTFGDEEGQRYSVQEVLNHAESKPVVNLPTKGFVSDQVNKWWQGDEDRAKKAIPSKDHPIIVLNHKKSYRFGGRIGYDYGGDVRTGDNPGGAADANRPAATSRDADRNYNAGSGTQTAGPSSDNRPDNRPDNSNDRFNIGGGNAPMPPQRGDDSFFGNMGGNIGSVLGGLAFGPIGSIGGRYLGNQFNQPDNSRFEAKNDEFGNPIGNSGGWLDFLGSGNPPAPMTSDNRRDPIKRKRRILMPDGTYQEVEEGMKSGGVAKSYNRVHNSKIVEHALSKVGVSLHTRRPPS